MNTSEINSLSAFTRELSPGKRLAYRHLHRPSVSHVRKVISFKNGILRTEAENSEDDREAKLVMKGKNFISEVNEATLTVFVKNPHAETNLPVFTYTLLPDES